MSFEILHSDIVFTGRAFAVKRYQMRLEGGRTTNFDIVQHPGAVTLVPVDQEGNLLFVRQYRLGAGKELLELPAGTLEPGEDPQVCAAREIREETGMGAQELVKLGEFFMAPGYSTEHMFVYMASGLYESPLAGDEDEFIRVEAIPVREAFQMVEKGQIEDGKTLACLLMARRRLLEL
ncbi:MAG TPA: NUDIX hydrolase [Anaerolineaceae bacterium]|nr:NUDIX hydrolase [Anaerolineaceae bacterium]